MYYFLKKIQIQKNTCIIAKYIAKYKKNTFYNVFFSLSKLLYRGGSIGSVEDFFLPEGAGSEPTGARMCNRLQIYIEYSIPM